MTNLETFKELEKLENEEGGVWYSSLDITLVYEQDFLQFPTDKQFSDTWPRTLIFVTGFKVRQLCRQSSKS